MTIVRASNIRLSDRDLERAAGLFGIRSVGLLGGFESVLFRSLDPPGRVLRITHASRRTSELIEGEFAFMRHLAVHDVSVVSPVPSVGGNSVESMETDDGQPVLVACMTEARGQSKRSADLSDLEIERYGELIGRMHVAAASFNPNERIRRPSWHDDMFAVGTDLIRVKQPDVFQALQQVESAAIQWSGDHHLLIHQDAHLGNLFLADDREITIFDFDDCAYGTTTQDVAIVIFYWLLGLNEDVVPAFRHFIERFLAGYNRHAELPNDWPNGADLFLSHREIDIYLLVSSVSESQSSAAERRFMVDRRRRIVEGIPYVGRPLSELI